MGHDINDKIETFMKIMDEYSKDGNVFDIQKYIVNFPCGFYH